MLPFFESQSITTFQNPLRLKRIFAATFFAALCLGIISMNIDFQLPIVRTLRGLPAIDKVAHFFVYGSLALFFNLAIRSSHFRFKSQRLDTRYLQFGSLAVLLFSLIEEYSQQYFPTRTMDLWDAVCNVAGVSFFTWVTVRLMARNSIARATPSKASEQTITQSSSTNPNAVTSGLRTTNLKSDRRPRQPLGS